jgi:hypothetical protein
MIAVAALQTARETKIDFYFCVFPLRTAATLQLRRAAQ